jgi:uncharacterized protein
MANNEKNDNTSKRGFASMDSEKQRQIASEGGKEAHRRGTAHEFRPGSEEASEAGRKGGQKSQRGPSKDNQDYQEDESEE